VVNKENKRRTVFTDEEGLAMASATSSSSYSILL